MGGLEMFKVSSPRAFNALAHDFCMVTWHHGVTFKSVRRVHLVTGRCPENARVLRAGSGRITPKGEGAEEG